MSSTTKPAPDAAAWDEAFERDLAKFLRDRLAADPPPSTSPIGHDAAQWAENLELRAEANRVGIGPYSPTEEAVLTEARHALKRYALRLPESSVWREGLAGIADTVARSVDVNVAFDEAGKITAERRREREQQSDDEVTT